MIQNEEDILQHIASRNPDRFRLIFRAFERQIKNYVCRVISTREDAEEVVQNTFMNAFRHLDDYKPERASLLTWLMRIATNEIRMYFRKKQPSLVSLDEEEEPLLLVSDDEADQILMETTENRINGLCVILPLSLIQISLWLKTILIEWKTNWRNGFIAFVKNSV